MLTLIEYMHRHKGNKEFVFAFYLSTKIIHMHRHNGNKEFVWCIREEN